MQEVKIDRLSVVQHSLILQCMKKAMYQAPTIEELYALEKRARLERAREVAALFRSLYHRAVSALTAKVVRHA
jgi:ribosomal protein L17